MCAAAVFAANNGGGCGSGSGDSKGSGASDAFAHDAPSAFWRSQGEVQACEYAIREYIALDSTGAAFAQIVEALNVADTHAVTAIRAVRNMNLWDAYADSRRRLARSLGEAGLNERWLYHGTPTRAAAWDITGRGFDRSHCVRAAHGIGCYFARAGRVAAGYAFQGSSAASSSAGHQPHDARGGDEEGYVFVSRVLTGESCIGERGKLPPARVNGGCGGGGGPRFESTTDPDGTLFAIAADHRAYPAYEVALVRIPRASSPPLPPFDFGEWSKRTREAAVLPPPPPPTMPDPALDARCGLWRTDPHPPPLPLPQLPSPPPVGSTSCLSNSVFLPASMASPWCVSVAATRCSGST